MNDDLRNIFKDMMHQWELRILTHRKIRQVHSMSLAKICVKDNLSMLGCGRGVTQVGIQGSRPPFGKPPASDSAIVRLSASIFADARSSMLNIISAPPPRIFDFFYYAPCPDYPLYRFHILSLSMIHE